MPVFLHLQERAKFTPEMKLQENIKLAVARANRSAEEMIAYRKQHTLCQTERRRSQKVAKRIADRAAINQRRLISEQKRYEGLLKRAWPNSYGHDDKMFLEKYEKTLSMARTADENASINETNGL